MASAQTAIPAGSIQLLPLLHLHRDVQVSSRWLKGTSKCLGFLMRWGVVCVRLCVGGLAPKDSPATPFPVPSHRRRPSSPSEDPPSPPLSPTAPLLVAMLSSHSPLSRPWLIWVLIRERKTDCKLHASKDLPALPCNDQVYQ